MNQFFAGIGGEEKAGIAPEIREGVIGPGAALAKELGDGYDVVATVICGDNYFGENLDEGQKEAAMEELMTTGDFADSVGQEKATEVIKDVKTEVIDEGLTDPEEIGEAVDTMKAFRFLPNVRPIRKKPYLWAQWWARNLSTVARPLNPPIAHNFKLCLNM